MSAKLKVSGKGQYSGDFRDSHALIIGINHYKNGIQPLTTPVNDAVRLGKLLKEEHGYKVHLLVEDIAKACIKRVITQELTPVMSKNDRLLVYFAGHGIALDGDDGPQGFLVPQDADPTDRDTLLPMSDLNEWLAALPCRHMLAILDCCFAGAFRWATTRNLDTAGLEVIHKERFERFVQSPAWQVLTSAAYNQKALDVVSGNAVGSRGIKEVQGERHSPFALALYAALRGEGDLIPKGDGDGVITATELYLYLRQQVEFEVGQAVDHDQTPGLWPLAKHDRGEYIFLTPGHQLNLPPAPKLTDKLNPWRGLKSYEYNEEHSQLFFGRDDEIQALAQQVTSQPFTAVLGASGTGKSSLVKAGLLPYLNNRQNDATDGQETTIVWQILSPMRPGRTPLSNLYKLLTEQLGEPSVLPSLAQFRQNQTAVANLITEWQQKNPQQILLLVIDQLEELVTLCQQDERERFLKQLANALEQHPDVLRLIITLRTDFEPQFNADTPLVLYWTDARYVVPPMNQADLRQVIEEPASVRVLYFDPPELVDKLIAEVLQTPGALPLLSFTLSEMYIHYLASERADRALTQADYDALGGVIGSLRNRANAEYEKLPDAAHQQTMERVMLRMISIEGGELARRRVHRSELDYPTDVENTRVGIVLDRLVEARLLVTGEDEGIATIEPAHDALVLAWDRLLRWKQAAELYLPLQRQLTRAATLWGSADISDQSGFLWDDDPRLPQLEEVLWPTGHNQQDKRSRIRWVKQVLIPNTKPPFDTKWLSRTDVGFVTASVEARKHFWRLLVVSISIISLVLLAATFISLGLLSRARVAEADAKTRQAEAEQQARIAESRSLSIAAQSLEDGNPELRLLLETAALQTALAIHKDVDFELKAPLFRALVSPYLTTLSGEFVGFNNDRSRIVTISEEKTWIWDAFSGNEIGYLDGLSQISSDGFRLFNVNDNGQSSLINTNTIETVETFSNERLLAFSPNGSRLATVDTNGFVRVRDSNDGQEISRLIEQFVELAESGIDIEGLSQAGLNRTRSVFFSYDGSRLVVGNSLWNGKTGEAISDSVLPVFSPDGSLLLSTDNRIISAENGEEISKLEQGSTSILDTSLRSISFSNDNHRIGDFTVLWDTLTGAILIDKPRVIAGRGQWGVSSPQFSPDNNYVVTGLGGEQTSLYHTGTGKQLFDFTKNTIIATQANFSNDSGKLVLNRPDTVPPTLFDVKNNRIISKLVGHNDLTFDAGFSPSDRLVVTTSWDGSARLWNSFSGEMVAVLPDHQNGVREVEFNANGSRLVTLDNAGRTRLWNSGWFEPLHTDNKYTSITLSIVDKSTILLCLRDWENDEDGFEYWEITTRKLVSSGNGCPEEVEGAGLLDRRGSGSDLTRHDLPEDESLLTISTDGSLLFTQLAMDMGIGEFTHLQRMRDSNTNELIAEIVGHTGLIKWATVNFDRSVLVTGAPQEAMAERQDFTTRFWDVSSGQLLFVLDPMVIESGKFTSDSNYLLATGFSNAFLWEVPSFQVEKMLDETRQRLTRSFTANECAQYFGDNSIFPCPNNLDELFNLRFE